MPENVTPSAAGWNLLHSYSHLPAAFHVRVEPTPVREPTLVVLNRPLATKLGLNPDLMDDPAVFAGNVLPPGALPLAQAYAGHQYAHFTMLGDGRAILLGEQVAPDGQRYDIQLKGPGITPFSRRGDGRAALGPMLREYIISEAMHALGIPSTRSLAVVTTGETVYRPEPLPGAVLTRVAASHIRVGTFEYAAARGNIPDLRALADYTLQRHYPELTVAEEPYLELFKGIAARQARLLAQWQLVGFVHGVMNTDNMALSGETIDYGPCAFMDAYDPATVFSSIDRSGHYAYGQQPKIAQWNLARLAEAMLPLLHPNEDRAIELATQAVEAYLPQYQSHWLNGMRRKVGLFNEQAEDAVLIQDLLDSMQDAKADFTNTFVSLTNAVDLTSDSPPVLAEWASRWKQRLDQQTQSRAVVRVLMEQHNPAFIPRNHRVEEALTAAENGDLSVMHRLLDVISRPYDHQRQAEDFRQPSDNSDYRTFCGT
ncbi:MAG: YdiU family protein [Verrucomicrobiaceae bacterium]|nr:YdiU family protein [Verrucomicrobiaceae bacterium]